MNLRECECKVAKKHRLVFDGGSTGNYTINLCSKCYENENKEFLISEEMLANV